MAWKGIVGARFSSNDLIAYLQHLAFTAWRPQFVVVHNTGVPNIQQRPNGFTAAQMQNLVTYYRDQMGWSAGPHCFIDQNGIWVFTPLTTSGVHSPSWNSITWGVESLGDYDTEPFQDPIHANLINCLASLHVAAGLDPLTMRLHKEDPKTNHKTCPGKNLDKSHLVAEVQAEMARRESGEHDPDSTTPVA